jgi:hypothetical protein
MRSTIDMKAVESIASSPDPRVRNVAQRRLEIEKEIEPLDAFLSYYINEAAPTASVISAMTNPRPRARQLGVAKSSSEKGKTLRMVGAAIQIVVDSKQPMTIDALYANMKISHDNLCPSNVASLRARLTEHKDKIARVDGRGYWPTDVAVPSPDA